MRDSYELMLSSMLTTTTQVFQSSWKSAGDWRAPFFPFMASLNVVSLIPANMKLLIVTAMSEVVYLQGDQVNLGPFILLHFFSYKILREM